MLSIIVLNVSMLFGAYLVGILPMIMNISQNYVQKTSVFGGGLLIGAALAIIIPEGFDILFKSAKADSESFSMRLSGFLLVLGFVFMLFIDQIGNSFYKSSIWVLNTCLCRKKQLHTNVSAFTNTKSINEEASQKSFLTTLGLVIHSAADGIALGAASALEETSLEIIVFFAIMIHKAPTAFGLTSVLLASNLSKEKIKNHLMAFCIAAPLLSILTYIFIYNLKTDQDSNQYFHLCAAYALLFSGGTFLYVAASHILPEIMFSSQKEQNGMYLLEEGSLNTLPHVVTKDQNLSNNKLTCIEFTLFFIGTLIPTLISLTHH